MRIALLNQKKRGYISENVNVTKNYNGVDVENLNRSKKHRSRSTKLSKKERQRKITRYITKYITKNDVEFQRLTWHCSRDVSALFTNVNFTDINDTELINVLSENCDKIETIENEYYTLHILKFDVPEILFFDMFDVNQQIYDEINNVL